MALGTLVGTATLSYATGGGRLPRSGTEGVVFITESDIRKLAFVNEAGAVTKIRIPTDAYQTGLWAILPLLVLNGNDVWMASGSTAMAKQIRHWVRSGSTLTLQDYFAYGDADTRILDFILLASGNMVLATAQHGTSPREMNILLIKSDATYTVLADSIASVDTNGVFGLVQHPSDNAIWLFGSFDGWSAIMARKMTESGSTLTLVFSDDTFIDSGDATGMPPDSEVPFVQVAKTSNKVLLAYQNNQRELITDYLGNSQYRTFIAVVEVSTDHSKSLRFVHNEWTERITRFALDWYRDKVWLTYVIAESTTAENNQIVTHPRGGYSTQIGLNTTTVSPRANFDLQSCTPGIGYGGMHVFQDDDGKVYSYMLTETSTSVTGGAPTRLSSIRGAKLAVRGPLLNLYRPTAGSGCVLWLPGQDDAKSTTIRDRSGNGNNGTFKAAGEPAWAREPSGLWSNDFDGTDDEINCGNNSSLNPTSISLLAWVYHGNLTQEGEVISRWATTNCYVFGITSTEVPFIKFVTAGGQNQVNGVGLLNQWYFLVATWDSTVGGALYVNNVSQGTTNLYPGNLVTSTGGTFIGNIWAGTTEYAFDGKIGLPKIYNRAISASEIASIFAQERGLLGV